MRATVENGVYRIEPDTDREEAALNAYVNQASARCVTNSGPIGDGGDVGHRLIGRIEANLWAEPNGVYRLDGRLIPVGDDAFVGVDDGKLVPGVHLGVDNREGLRRSAVGVHIPQ